MNINQQINEEMHKIPNKDNLLAELLKKVDFILEHLKSQKSGDAVECFGFKSYQKGSLVGFADLYIPDKDLEIKGCSVFMKDGRRWISFPSKKYTNKEGEEKNAPHVSFREKSNSYAFSEKAIKAIEKFCANQPPQQKAPVYEKEDHEENLPF